MKDSPLLEARALGKSFFLAGYRIDVLKGLDLKVFPRDTMAVVGASGAGKSTLLHILGTLDRPTSGEVLFEGQNLYQRSAHELAGFRNGKIGFVFQFHHLLPEFSTLENTMMPLLIARATKKEAQLRAEELLTQVGLKERLSHRIGELSGGEQQRVAIARALAREPQLILADEPTGNLDRKTGDQIMQLFWDLNQRKNITLLTVTHNLDLARRFGRLVEILDGRAVEVLTN
jgi:lipoprotein-releasing system ATP-binding protein